ncbi:RluA family pseudouridine synthase [Parashewanella curva]|uniref:RluA family pseudouridine synthase n=1 Tax=Parashewanella curva TaxID=2338552 RepID=A0A3L8Q0W8_9GAMM|nr:RluA family pseudouridine synthase [Parashewanella curva]RLV61100.1 RluA family pseudouridine synthase [Parashewanella curva]
MDKLELTLPIDESNYQTKPSQLLASSSQLTQAQIKDAMHKGAVWLYRGKSKQRLRRASKSLLPEDKLELNYNSQLLQQSAPAPSLIFDGDVFSVWFKPFGLNCQGSRWADHLSINRWVESNFHKLTGKNERPVFLIHRLDRATSGLILLCHTKKAARLFSEMFHSRKVDKRYQAIVHGDFSSIPMEYLVDHPIDNKPSSSKFSFVGKNEKYSKVDVKLLTGRKHQIRKHLSFIEFPIVGDRMHGISGDEARDLQLQAVSLSFICPFTQKLYQFKVEDSLMLSL